MRGGCWRWPREAPFLSDRGRPSPCGGRRSSRNISTAATDWAIWIGPSMTRGRPAAVVYESGAPLVQIGLDVCQKVSFTESQLSALGRDGGIPARRLAEMSRFIADAYQKTPAPVKRWSQYGATGRVYFNDVPAM